MEALAAAGYCLYSRVAYPGNFLWQHDEKTAVLRQSHPALHHLLETEKAWFTENGFWPHEQSGLVELFTSAP
jgi:hypothetical protein